MGDMFIFNNGRRHREWLVLQFHLNSCTHRLVYVSIDHASKRCLRGALVRSSPLLIMVITASYLAVG